MDIASRSALVSWCFRLSESDHLQNAPDFEVGVAAAGQPDVKGISSSSLLAIWSAVWPWPRLRSAGSLWLNRAIKSPGGSWRRRVDDEERALRIRGLDAECL